MKNQALFSSNNSKKSKFCQLQFLFGALRVKMCQILNIVGNSSNSQVTMKAVSDDSCGIFFINASKHTVFLLLKASGCWNSHFL